MYSTCLFCHADLGHNAVVEAFPVGRRLAFDAAKGRLWVVCRRCERWNLTPLDERWEAIDECERRYRDVRTRVSTDNIGLARLREGLELVRIGRPQRPEMAAWRYGDQFGRRRLTGSVAIAGSALTTAAVALTPAAFMAASVAIGGAMGMGFALAFLWGPSWAAKRLQHRQSAESGVRVTLGNGDVLGIAAADIGLAQLLPNAGETRLRVVAASHERSVERDRERVRLLDPERRTHALAGDDVVRVAGALLPRVNRLGGGERQVQRAVRALEEAPTVERLFQDAAVAGRRRYDANLALQLREVGALASVPPALRLALEMAAHEDQERRALEGELAELEGAWRAAEEVAGIADALLVPDAVTRTLARLRTGLPVPRTPLPDDGAR